MVNDTTVLSDDTIKHNSGLVPSWIDMLVPWLSSEPQKSNYTEAPKRYFCDATFASDSSKWSSGTPTVFALDTFSTNSKYMSTTTSQAITIPVSGKYLLIGRARRWSNSSSYRVLYLYLNWGATFSDWLTSRDTAAAANWASTTNLVMRVCDLKKWDYIQLFWAQESWSSLTLYADTCLLQVLQIS